MNFNRRKKTEEKKGFKFAWVVGLMLLILIFVPITVFGVYQYNVSTPVDENNESEVYFNLKEGVTRDDLAADLQARGLISDSTWLVWYSRISGRGGDLKAGNHILRPNMSIIDIIEELETVPQSDTVWVTIPEGLRYDEIAAIIAEDIDSPNFSEQEFLRLATDPWATGLTNQSPFLAENLPQGNSIEGFLYPDTYNFDSEVTTQQVILKLVSTLDSKIKAEGLDIENSDLTLYEVLNIAAMIEREAFTQEEAYMISDIIQSRLEIGMALGIDATSLYDLKDWKAPLTFRELQDPNPYNTRLNAGLPPTPIANPGISTIDATLNPKANDYFFYLHGSDGQIHYGKTNAEHEANKKYL